MAVWKAEAMEVSALSITDRLGVASAFFLLLATDLILLLGKNINECIIKCGDKTKWFLVEVYTTPRNVDRRDLSEEVYIHGTISSY